MRVGLRFIFVDRDRCRVEHLERKVRELTLPPHIRTACVSGEFGECFGGTLDMLERSRSRLAPTFLFVDPFGIKGVSYQLLRRFMRYPRCEFLVTFMVESILRWGETPEFEPHLAGLAEIVNAAFAGREASIEDLQSFTVVATDYRKAHIKQALKLLQGQGKLIAVKGQRRWGTYPKGSVVRFVEADTNKRSAPS